MVTIKSYTDIEQSKKLAEILPIESADMYWWSTSIRHYIEAMDDGDFNEEEGHIRAWSLAALLNVLPKSLIYTPNPTLAGYCCKNIMHDLETYGDNPIDACYEMILQLHEQNLI